MAEVGLHPKGVLWDSNWHRFPGIDQKRGDSGRYKAFVDQRGALFMDMRTGQSWKWPQDFAGAQERMKEHFKPMSGEEVRRKQEAYEKERAEKEGKHLRAIRNLWERAKDCANHPYLGNKGIRDVPLLRSIIDPDTEQEMLLIPMRNAEGELRCLQRVWPNGDRLYMPQAGGVKGLYNTIGSQNYMQSKTLYICEGWATGWTIHKASGCAVIVAFTYSGLLTVGRIIQEKYPEARIVFAADNDRWKLVKRDGAMVNIGVYAAKHAAQALNAEYCIPDFPDLSTKPTDYDDLRQLADLAVVRDRLDPAKADQAVITPPAPEEPDDPPPEEPEPESKSDTSVASEREAERDDRDWSADAPFRCLGTDHDRYFFMAGRKGQVLSTSGSTLPSKRGFFLQLAPLEWWEEWFGGRKGPSWIRAADALITECDAAGIFRPEGIRGRGCWRDEDDRVVLHLGDRLLAPGKDEYQTPDSYKQQNAIYPRLARLPGAAGTGQMTLGESKRIADLFQGLDWEAYSSGTLLAGWCALAPHCGALKWRPHVWITGPTSCGKTTVVTEMVIPLLGGMRVHREGLTSEAGIRQALQGDALPVLIDEVEQHNRNAESKVQGMLQLARSASSGGVVSKGTPGGTEMRYEAKSMFLFSSTVVGIRQQADRNRTSILELKSPDATDYQSREDNWNRLQREIADRITVRTGRLLVARTLQWFRDGRFDKLLVNCRGAVRTVLNDARAADQYGALLAGAQMLTTDAVPRLDELVDWVKDLGLQSYMPDPVQDGLAIIELLFQAEVQVDSARRLSVGEIVDIVQPAGAPHRDSQPTELTPKEAAGALKRLGLRVYPANYDEEIRVDSLFIANTSKWVDRRLRNTPYRDGWRRKLRTIPSAVASQKQRYVSGSFRNARGTLVPIKSLPVGDGARS